MGMPHLAGVPSGSPVTLITPDIPCAIRREPVVEHALQQDEPDRDDEEEADENEPRRRQHGGTESSKDAVRRIAARHQGVIARRTVVPCNGEGPLRVEGDGVRCKPPPGLHSAQFLSFH